MLLRQWATGVDVSRAAEYEAFAAEVSLPMFRAHRGFIGIVMSRVDASCLVETFWEDERSIRALESSQLYNTTVRKIEALGLLRGEQRLEVRRVHAAYWSMLVQTGPQNTPGAA